MSPMQQMLLGVGASTKATYVDDIFSTYLFKGNATARSINNAVDLSSEGGMVWLKNRDGAFNHTLFDTVRGTAKIIRSSTNGAETSGGQTLTAFNNNGFTLGTDSMVNSNNDETASWSFRKAPGFFDVVTYTGNGASGGRTIAHSLGSVPGLILIKRTDATAKWIVYHRDTGASKSANLNNSNAFETDVYSFNQTEPTSTNFTLGEHSINQNNEEYVAYLFAGGESTAATARSVDFDGTGDELTVASSTDHTFGSGNFTIECWFKVSDVSLGHTLVALWNYPANRRSWALSASSNGTITFSVNPTGSGTTTNVSGGSIKNGQWYHVAAVRDGNTLRVFVNGIQVKTASYTGAIYDNTTDPVTIGAMASEGGYATGQISNVRVVKGTAVYTSSFRPTYEPLTNITNTKLLCCNNSSTTGSTVTPGTITANGDPTAITDSPFDDPAGFVFGDAGDQNVIKCGSYVGNGSSDGPEINLGFEPQWILIKRSSASESWMIFDAMRGMTTQAGNDHDLRADSSNSEGDTRDYIDITPTGFKQVNTQAMMNGNGDTYIYMCIRRPDGYVGKPPELGTGVFTMATGSGGSTFPGFNSGFPVDLALARRPASSDNWYTYSRFTGTKYVRTDTNAAQLNDTSSAFDSNVGWYTAIANTYQSWMFKRHAGLDMVTYVGNQTSGHDIAHSCGQAPEMIWTKNRDQTQSWHVGHKDLNGGTNPWDYYLVLSDSPNEQENGPSNFWEAPTATHFTVGSDARVNRNNDDYLAILFSSVNGISKVGSYTGSSNPITVTTNFTPRFVIIKNASSNSYNSSTDWFVFDTTRGWASGNNDKLLRLNEADVQTTEDWTNPTSTGFTINADSGNDLNNNGDRYIYYCHA